MSQFTHMELIGIHFKTWGREQNLLQMYTLGMSNNRKLVNYIILELETHIWQESKMDANKNLIITGFILN